MLLTVFSPFLADLFARHEFSKQCRQFASCWLVLMALLMSQAAMAAAPVIVSSPDTAVDEDSFYTYSIVANDADNNPLTFSAPSLPAWLTFNSGSATISGTPTNDSVGTHSVTMAVSDGTSTIEQIFSIVVKNINDQPTIVSNIANIALIEDVDFTLDITENFLDVDTTDTLLYTADNLPTGLALSPLGIITGAPNNDDAITFSFNVTITAVDLAKTSVSTLFQIIVANVNDAPAPVDDTVTLSEDSNIIIDVLKNDIDVDDVILPSSTVIITKPLHGEATVDTTNGLITYTPVADYAGPDSLEYRITDPLGLPGTATVNITVLAVNDPPVAHNDVVSTTEDTQIDIDVLNNDTDPDVGDAPQGSQLVIDTPPSNGSVLIINGLLQYTPNPDFNGTDTLKYKVADLSGIFTEVATVTITVGPVNDIPVAGDDIATTLEDTPVIVVVVNNDTDTEDPVLDVATMSIVNQPLHGTAAINSDGTITYRPALNYNGPDSLQYTIKDSSGLTSNAATLSITVNPVNDTPVANSDLVSMDEDTLLEINVLGNDTDVDGNDTINVASVEIVNAPDNGSLFIDTTTGVVQYTPNADYFGGDSFIYQIADIGGLISSNATVSITINSVNDSPRLVDDSATTDEDTPITISILPNDADVDGTLDLTTLAFVTTPAHGTVVFNADGNVVFTPDLNYHGNDLFSYTISDNNGLVSATAASVLLTINSINDRPLADDNALTLREDKTLIITLTGSDVDDDPLGFIITRQPLHGTIVRSGTNWAYTPELNYNGPDSFNFQATDGIINSATANVTLTILAVNDRPIATAQTVTLNEDSSITFVLTGTDIDLDPLTFALAGGNLGGIITGTPPTITYTPAENFNGTEKLSFFANDGDLDSSVEAITITVIAVNDDPTVGSQSLFLVEDGSVSILLEAEDIDNDTLSYIIEQPPSDGILTGTAPNLLYTPNENFNGDDSFSYRVNDGLANSALGNVSLKITPSSDAPFADSLTVVGNEDTDIIITLTGADPDGNSLTYQLLSSPVHGTLQGTPPNLSYRGNPNFYGNDNLSFKVSDGNLESAAAVVSITIEPVNDRPQAFDDIYEESMDGKQWLTLDVLDNDVDLDDDDLILLTGLTDFGTVSVNENHLRFAPEPGFAGNVLLTYLMQDPAGEIDSARVHLTIIGADNANIPVIEVPDDINVYADGRITKVNFGAATAIDKAGNAIPVGLINNNDRFKPGAHAVFWKATDNQGNSAIASQAVNIYPLVSLSRGQQVEAGAEAKVIAKLNGPAPFYPVVIPYTLEGDAIAGIDYELEAGEIRFEEGTETELEFETFKNTTNSGSKAVVIVLSDSPSASFERRHAVNIVEHNVAPRIKLSSSQDGQRRFLIERSGGKVVVVVGIDDINAADGHNIEWMPGNGITRDNEGGEAHFVFVPTDMVPAIYNLAARVTDNGEPAAMAESQIYIELVESLPTLGNGDSDGDLISDAIEGFKDDDRDHIPDYLDAISDCNVVPQKAAEPQHYLVEGETGGCLRRGRLTIAGDNNGLLVDTTALGSNLPADPDTTNIGGLFDFEVHNLATSEGAEVATYNLVLPQRQPIPIDAIYRKYSQAKGWYTFIIDDNNKIWSAAGSAGICPPPKDERWVEGLQEGDWCIQLTIEDGGSNDNDGVVNNSISDPGGVAVYNSSNHFPVATADMAEVKWNSTTIIDVLANDTDEDNDSLAIVNANAQFGEASIVDEQTIRYQALENYIGEDIVNYSISDGHGGIASTTLTINVKGNTTPEAVDDTASTTSKVAIIVDVLANDRDDDDDEITLVSATVNIGNIIVTNDSKLQYTPLADFEGTVTVVYMIEDSAGATDEGQLLVAVTKIVEPPAPEPEPPVTPPASDSGGGSMGYWWLLLMVAVVGAASRRERRGHSMR
jgi:hypothetical protein